MNKSVTSKRTISLLHSSHIFDFYTKKNLLEFKLSAKYMFFSSLEP